MAYKIPLKTDYINKHIPLNHDPIEQQMKDMAFDYKHNVIAL